MPGASSRLRRSASDRCCRDRRNTRGSGWYSCGDFSSARERVCAHQSTWSALHSSPASVAALVRNVLSSFQLGRSCCGMRAVLVHVGHVIGVLVPDAARLDPAILLVADTCTVGRAFRVGRSSGWRRRRSRPSRRCRRRRRPDTRSRSCSNACPGSTTCPGRRTRRARARRRTSPRPCRRRGSRTRCRRRCR